MRRAIELALASGVAIGAHPGYEDREHFGRRAMALRCRCHGTGRRQIARLAAIAEPKGEQLHHVKAHGALYNQADRDPVLAAAVVEGITALPGSDFYAPPAGALAAAGQAAGLTLRAEGFADRRYLENGSLIPRGDPGAVIKNVEEAVAQAMEIVANGTVETLCVHGDGPTAVAILQTLRGRLEDRGHRIGCKTRVDGACTARRIPLTPARGCQSKSKP